MSFTLHTAELLRLLTRQVNLPFDIALPTDKLHCKKILRQVPGRRLVVAGIWQNQPVVAKLFFHASKAARDFNRENQGITHLMQQDLLTPHRLHQTASNGLYVVIYEQLEALTLLEAIVEPEQAWPLLQQLTQLIAQQHNVGIWQKDLHLNNFLVKEGKIYTIDGADVCYENHLPLATALQNFALFLLQIPKELHTFCHSMTLEYCTARHIAYNESLQCKITHYLHKANQYRQRKFLEKALRDCTATAIIKTKQHFIAYDRNLAHPEWQSFLRDPTPYFRKNDTVMLKNGNTCTVVAATVGGQRVVIKRYNIKNKWHALTRLFRTSRARCSWLNARLLQYCSINTPKPYALIEQYKQGFPSTAYYVAGYIEGDKLRDYFTQAVVTDEHRRVAKQMAHFFKACTEFKLSHGDTKADNFIVAQNQIYVIDLDALRKHRFFYTFSQVYHKDIQRFFKNWQLLPAIHRLFSQLFAEMGLPEASSRSIK